MKYLFPIFPLLIAVNTHFSRPSQKPVNMLNKPAALTLTILYDNYTFNSELESDWGFSCLIEGLGKTILFDTGTKGNILLENMKKMGKDPSDVEVIVLSHIHQDHTGGMEAFLKKNHNVKVYSPESFPDDFHQFVINSGAELIKISGPVKILDNLYTTGEMGVEIIEQSIVITTAKGNIVITGCAHPGIVDIVKKAREVAGNDMLLVMGGFHLLRTSSNNIDKIIGEFKEMGIKYAGPSHCSGDKTIDSFREKYGDHFIEMGVGRVIRLEDL